MFDLLEQIIADHFCISHESLLQDSCRTASDARHFLWFVLHGILGYSSNNIAKRYGVSKRCVLQYSSVVRNGIRTQPFYSRNFQGIQSKLKVLDLI